jgi:ABC-2 type transport system ATP-binding protein
MVTSMSEEAVKVQGLTKVFNGGLVAVDHVDFSVRRGEIFGFLGPNGAGKTTTINMLLTVLRPTKGKASVLGKDISKQSMDVREAIGVVPQECAADDELTAYENILLWADLYGLDKAFSRRRALDLLKLVELTAFKDKKVQTYSGGMRRRLELACGLISQPQILFLDEPTLGLDAQTRTAFWKYITKLKKESGITIFLTTHYLEEADALCDRVAIIDHGKILVIGTPEQLKRDLGGDMITLKTREDKDVSTLIQKVEHVKDIKKENGSYQIRTESGEVTAPALIEDLRKNGYTVTSLSLSEPTLNDVYLKYTGRSMRVTEESKESFMSQRMALGRVSK